jgi:aminoglycoside phosphotransferase (APT) family kinase protein
VSTAHSDSEPLVDLDRLNEWAGLETVPGTGRMVSLKPLPGGAQNLLFTLRRADGTEIVLRRPGKHVRADAAATFLREARVLGALSGTRVPHPRLYAHCVDQDVIGVPFCLMEKIEGFTPRGELPGRYGTDPRWRRAMALELVEGAASLAAVHPHEAGLDDLSKTDDWLQRQIARYTKMLHGYRDNAEYRDSESVYVDGVRIWLEANTPKGFQVGIVHGDLQFANVMFQHGSPRLAAIVDWEMAALGDPLVDLAWILTAWREEGDPPGSEPYIRPWSGIPSRAELVGRYGELTGRDDIADSFPWFQVLAHYRLAALLEGSYFRALNGKMDRRMGQGLHDYAQWQWAKAHQEISR